MLKTILVPIDGSELAEKAVPYAVVLGRATGAELLFVEAIISAGSITGDAVRFNAEVRGDAEDDLRRVVTTAREGGAKVDSIIWDDEPGWAILGAAEQKQADLIVMSTHGRTGVGRWIYGSIADRVLRRSTVPVLLVPPSGAFSWSPGEPFRIMVALDGSQLSEAVLAPSLELARALSGEIVLITAVGPPNYWTLADAYATFDLDADIAAARTYLEETAARVKREGVHASFHVAEGPPDLAIAEAARNFKARMIALASHGRGGMVRAVMGSTAQSLLRVTPVPVLVARPSATSTGRASASPPATELVEEEALVGLLLTLEDIEVISAGLTTLLGAGRLNEAKEASARELIERLHHLSEPNRARVPQEGGA
jgi:nucleotide-binding universal stress UspA family protein